MTPQNTFAALARKYKTPKQVQQFLRAYPYNRAETMRSAYTSLQHNEAHCFEATFIAAAILELNGYPPLIVSFESMDGLDHVIFVFKENGRWGSVARSRDEGLHGREPVFRSIRDLIWSYYASYIDGSGKIIGYQLASLDDTGADWRTGKKNIWKAEKYLLKLKHRPLKSSEAYYQKLLRKFRKHGHLMPEKYGW